MISGHRHGPGREQLVAVGLPLCYGPVQPGISKEDAPWEVRVRPQPEQRENGLVASLARPGGVIIGAELGGKRLEFIVQAVNAVGESSDGGKSIMKFGTEAWGRRFVLRLDRLTAATQTARGRSDRPGPRSRPAERFEGDPAQILSNREFRTLPFPPPSGRLPSGRPRGALPTPPSPIRLLIFGTSGEIPIRNGSLADNAILLSFSPHFGVDACTVLDPIPHSRAVVAG
jgi:hypothetical protein